MSEVTYTLDECIQYLDTLIKRDDASTVDIAIKKQLERQRALIERAIPIIRNHADNVIDGIADKWLKDACDEVSK